MALAIAGFQPRHDRRIPFGEPRAKGLGAHRLPFGVGLSRTPAGNSGMAAMPCINVRR